MRLLFLNWFDRTHPLWGGAEVYLHEIGKRLVARGHQVTLLCSRYAGCESESVVDGIRVLRRGHFWTFHLEVPWYYRRELAGAGSPGGECKTWDCVFEYTNKVPMLTPLYVKAPLVAVAHHLWGASIFQESTPPVAACVYAMERLLPLIYRKTPWISVSQSTRAELASLGIPPANVHVIPNGLDESWLAAPARPEPVSPSVRPDHASGPFVEGPHTRKPTIAWIGRMKRYKRVDVLLRAMPHVLRHVPHATLHLAGDGIEAPRLRALAAALDLGPDRVRFLGTIPEDHKRDLLQSASLLAQPSAKEGWGRTVLEAAACGVPTVASDVPGLRESVRHGETGLLVPPGDSAALAQAIVSLLQNPARRTNLGQAARDWASHFSWHTAADATERIARNTASHHFTQPASGLPILGPTAGSA